MTNTTARTPGPWTACLDAYSEGWSTIGSNGGNDGIWVASLKGPDHLANTAFIVRAANSHDELLSALTECAEALRMVSEPSKIRSTSVHSAWATCVAAEQKARAALAKARQP